jgi:predicted Zn finger-like uncharacterized protein
MNIRCRQCNSQFNIPDDKLPKNKDAVFKCPKCKEKIQIPATASPGAKGLQDLPVTGSGPVPPPQKQERALVLVSDGPFLQPVMAAVRQLGFAAETGADPADALKKMAYHVYPLVVLEDRFDQGRENILVHMNTLDMSVRRMTCLVLMGRQVKTGDPMAALHASVNQVVGPDGLGQLPVLLSAALTDHTYFYRVYMDSMKAVGKA